MVDNRGPEDWEVITIGQIANIMRGASPRPIDDSRWFSDEGPGWVRIADVTRSNGRLRETEQYLSDQGVAESRPVKPGQLIMSICATIGEPAIVEIDACIHDGFVVFDFCDGVVDTLFFFHFLRDQAVKFRSKGQTGTQANLNTDIVKATNILLPPLDEQRRIAEILDTIDEAIQKTEAVIAKLKQMREGLLHDLLTRGLDENGKLRDPVAHPEQFKDSPLGRIPRTWVVKTLQAVANIVMGQSPSGYTYNKVGEGLPLINGPAEFSEHYPVKLQWTTEPTKLCQPNDILFCVRGSTTGRINISNDVFCIGRGIAAIRGKKGIALTGFVELFLRQLAEAILSEARGSGSTFPSVTSDRLASTLLSMPSVNEQRRITNFLDTHDTRIRTEGAYCDKLKRQKKGMMDDLLTGRVRV